jgi:YD repeat-containing protein
MRGKRSNSARWLFVFALVLLACTATSVLARSTPKPVDRGTYLRVNGSRIGVSTARAVSVPSSDAQASGPEIETEPQTEEESEGASPPSTPVQPVQTKPALEPIKDGPLHAPSVEEVQAVIEVDKRAQATKENWLESEEAVRQREESRHAFVDISESEAEGLLPQFFSKQLAALKGDPARLIADLDVVKSLGPNAALISEGEGEFSLLESSAQIESEVGQDSKQPLDIELELSGEGFTPKNPLADMSLPDSALGSVHLESGVEIGLPAGADSAARPVEGVGLIYPESEKATDTVVAPVTAGVEVFQQLRSPQSPETTRFNFNLPPEARLAPTEGGGAAVVSASGENLVWIPPPWAVDAQGTAVPVAMSIEDHSLVLAVSHRSSDLAYPILVDPAFIEEGAPVGNWGPAWTDQYNLWNNPVLGAQAKGSSYSYAANSFGHWVWTTHGGTTYISQATFSPTTFTLPSNCATEQPTNQPHGYAGLYNPSTGGYSGLGIWFGGSSSGGYGTLENAGGPGVRQAIVGIGVGSSSVKHQCAITFEVGGVTVRQKDPEAPTFNSVQASSAWTAGHSNVTVGTTVSDPGLGVKQIDIHPEGASEAPAEFHDIVGCAGTYSSQCPASRYRQFVINPAQFQAGETTTKLTAKDVLGGVGHESTYTFPTRVDRTPPVVDLQGQLATITKQEGKAEKEQALGADELRFPVYNLQIKATDVGPNGNPAGNPWERRSGVKNIKVFLRDEELEKEEELKVPWTAQGCSGPTYSCPMEKTYPLELAGREMGDYRLRVLVEDQVGRTTERKLKFTYIPATGMKDEYVMQYFPLPDGSGDEDAEEHPRRPELAVNVMSGNLVFRQRDVDVEGPAADLEVERFYNSQLPESEDTEWGDGWTLAQTPSLEPEGEGTPTEATMVAESGLVQSEVELPSDVGEGVFDEKLQAVVSKEPTGYTIADESEGSEGTIAFDEAGEASELRMPGYAEIDYAYEEGDLAEISIDDPGSTNLTVEEAQEWEELQNTPAFVDAFGSYGTGPGQFDYAGDIGQTPEGDFWVADPYNHRIQKLDAEGNQLDVITQAADGKRLMPNGLAVDPAGNVLITDSDHHRVEVFDSNGNFVRRFGGGWGTAQGQFRHPQGLTIDPQGDVLVTDMLNGRLQEFSTTGTFKRVVGSEGSGPGQIQGPADVAVAPDGTIWVADFEESDIEVLKADGTFVRSFGASGSGNGQFASPVAIALGAKGQVWVADMGNGRLQQFDSQGTFIRSVGSEGSGEGQFQFGWPVGIVADGEGSLWITDGHNDRVQEWAIPGEEAVLPVDAFGSYGTGPGQFDYAGDIGQTPSGDFWVADPYNHRIQKLDAEGNQLDVITQAADGKRLMPNGLAVDPAGNVLITDSDHHRVEVFNSNGNFVRRFGGGWGTATGQFRHPQGLTVDPQGDVLVTDMLNGRLQEFSATGIFKRVVGSEGSGPGQLDGPADVAVAPDGTIWVADFEGHDIEVLKADGTFVRSFGSYGTADGQFAAPVAIALGAKGQVWVADMGNGRLQQFDSEGTFVRSVGSEGSGEGQFQFGWPVGIVADGEGVLWITDGHNDRVQRWRLGRTSVPGKGVPQQDDPAVEVEVSDGLVNSVIGEEAGPHLYAHEGDLLTAYGAAEGTTHYEYNGDDRLSGVTFPNGTYGQITYDSKGRVKSVAISDEGAAAETTTFQYQDEPTRRTTVKRPNALPIIYDLGEDGSVFKWQSEKAPPGVVLSGSLYAGKETSSSIEPGDYELVVEAASPAADITSIQVIADGSTLVDEKTCGAPCPQEEDRWVTNTGNWVPGILHLEVLVTDSTGAVTSKRFWVNIPYAPPPAPDEEDAPTFQEIAGFREHFGLDLDIQGDERALNNRIFDLIWAWNHPGTPAGEVARATTEQWGSPLRPGDAAELEYRNWYLEVVGGELDKWGAEHYPSTYAGYTIDQAAGGVIRAGFTANQAGRLEEFKSQVSPPAADRLQSAGVAPAISLSTLGNLEAAVSEEAEADPALNAVFNEVWVDIPGNVVKVGASDTAKATQLLTSAFGSSSPIVVVQTATPENTGGRNRATGRMYAGDRVVIKESESWCTAGFGAYERRHEKSSGELINAPFFLLTGHCFAKGIGIWRSPYAGFGGKDDWAFLGDVTRSPYEFGGGYVDVEAVRLESSGIAPRRIYGREGRRPLWKAPAVGHRGQNLCFSGATTQGVRCGEVVGIRRVDVPEDTRHIGLLVVAMHSEGGDSGSPVWASRGHAAIGLLKGHIGNNFAMVQPLLDTPNGHGETYPGALKHPQMFDMHLMVGD